jgi:peptide-methionine (R)-S-oxide reductase
LACIQYDEARFLQLRQEKAMYPVDKNPKASRPEKIVHSDEEWRANLTPEQYSVLREKATERPFTGALYRNNETGSYHCAGCGALLFSSSAKFDAGCGWPSFTIPAHTAAIDEHEDLSFGMRRIEVTCAHCGGHLGHVFPDGPRPTGLRYCINSASLTFEHVEPGNK